MLSRISINLILIASVSAGQGLCSDFVSYLDSLGLDRIASVEIERKCIEECDPTFCLSYLERTRDPTRKAEIDSAFKHGCRSNDRDALKLIVEAGSFLAQKRVAEAETLLTRAVSLLPSVDLMVESAILGAKINQARSEHDLALEMLEEIDDYVQPSRMRQILYLKGLSELKVDPDMAIAHLKGALEKGVTMAAADLLRAYLVKPDTASFRQTLSELSSSDKNLIESISELACEIGDLIPEIGQQIIEWLLINPSFRIKSESCILKRLTQRALVDTCLARLAKRLSPYAADDQTYAHLGFVWAISSRSVDSLVYYATASPDWEMRLRSCLMVISQLTDGGHEAQVSQPYDIEAVIKQLNQLLCEHRFEIAPYEKLKIVGTLVKSCYLQSFKEVCTEYLKEICGDHLDGEIGIAELAVSLEPRLAKELAEEVISSPDVGLETITAKKILWDLEWLIADSRDLRSALETALKLDDDRKAADYFSYHLKQPDKALGYYRRALRKATGSEKDSLMLGLGRCLARLVNSGKSDYKEETYAIVTKLAASDAISCDDVIDLALAATDFLKSDRWLVVKIARDLLDRDKLEAKDLSQILKVSYLLFLLGEADAYKICNDVIERLIVDFRSSLEAGLAMLIDAKINLSLKTYSTAIKRLETAAKEWAWLRSSAMEGLAECYIRLGKIEAALDVLRSCEPRGRVLYKQGRCFDVLGETDSALFYYRQAFKQICDDVLLSQIRFDLGRCVVEREQSVEWIESLANSPACYCDPKIADDIHFTCLLLKSLLAARKGYGWIAQTSLLRLAYLREWLACKSRLILADLMSEQDPFQSITLLPKEGQCIDHMVGFEILMRKAKYACMTDSIDVCLRACKEFEKSYPFAKSISQRLRAMQLLEGLGLEHEAGSALLDAIASQISDSIAVDQIAYYRASRSIARGQYRPGIELLLPIVRKGKGPLYYQSCFRLGSAYYMTGAYDSAGYYFEIASSIDDPRISRDALFNAGLSYESAGQSEKALENFWKCAIRFPLGEQFDRSLLRSGFALEELGRHKAAIDIYRAVVGYSMSRQTKAEAQYWLAQCFAVSGQHQRSVVEYLRCFYLFGDQEAWAATCAFEAGVECETLGWFEEAGLIYKAIIARYGESTEWGRSSRLRLDRLGVD